MHDYIGAESCVDLRKNLEDYHTTTATGSASNTRRRERRKQAADRVLPPPIPSCNVPWVMTRYQTSDGRLVIKRERAKRQVCLEKLRSNGRLVLNLVPLDGGDAGDDPEIDGGDEKDPTVEMVHPVDGCCKQSWVIGGVAMPSQWIIRT